MLDRVIAVNVRGPFLCGQQAARRMAAAGGGRIVNIASTASVQAWSLQTAYGASKGGVALLTKNMAVELAPLEIAVNAIGPGTIDTPLAVNLTATRPGATTISRARRSAAGARPTTSPSPCASCCATRSG